MERRTFESLGGECELFAIGVDPDALVAAEAWIRRRHDRLTRFDPSSDVSRLNASGGRWLAVSAELEVLLRESMRAFELSDGLVNVAVLPALLAAGYTRDFAAGPTARSAAPRIPPLTEVLQLRPGEARLVRGGAIDLGGIAKGWLADRVAERLGENVLVNQTVVGRRPSPHRSTHRTSGAERSQRSVGTGVDRDRCRDLREGRAASRFARGATVARAAIAGVVASVTKRARAWPRRDARRQPSRRRRRSDRSATPPRPR
ncbi:MAG: FAD:protein FMN transferase [Chloroflexi bacterium]|nr:MAG: FAD:protein FMN transferase [Chloroflexota bacterium]